MRPNRTALEQHAGHVDDVARDLGHGLAAFHRQLAQGVVGRILVQARAAAIGIAAAGCGAAATGAGAGAAGAGAGAAGAGATVSFMESIKLPTNSFATSKVNICMI